MSAVVGSLLTKLTVEFLLIRARHPLPVVLMHRHATNLAGTLLRVSFGLVDAFAMSQTCHGIESERSGDCEWD
nr:hypothetical protein [Synechococcus sp. WH 7805]